MSIFRHKGLVGVRFRRYQIDWRDRLPLSIRTGLRRTGLGTGWLVLPLGPLGYITAGRLQEPPRRAET